MALVIHKTSIDSFVYNNVQSYLRSGHVHVETRKIDI